MPFLSAYNKARFYCDEAHKCSYGVCSHGRIQRGGGSGIVKALQAKVCARITGKPLVQVCPGKSVVTGELTLPP